MSVNFSSHDFAESDFVSHVSNTVDRTGVEPAQIRLEITERALIQQPAKAKQALDECRSRGMGVAIDDFGTGYSSLRYLHYYPIETLKVDQSFTRVMQTEARSFELVRSIIALGKNLNMTVVTEGVETSEEARLLRAMGCDTAQGYYFAKPMTEDAIIEMLGRWNPTRKAV
jgi:EAL domain-containing protein (putative c-di-GMP-specific phosphodiesterase class I)